MEYKEQVEQWFSEHENEEYLKFNRISDRFGTRPDLHAFIMLSNLWPNTETNVICGANHDVIYLGSVYSWTPFLTESIILDLLRCGVLCQDGHLVMNV